MKERYQNLNSRHLVLASNKSVHPILNNICQLVFRSRMALIWLLLFAFSLLPLKAGAQNGLAKLFHQDHLTGNWGGLRTRLAAQGLSFEAVFTGENFANVSGGLQRRGTFLYNADLVLTADAGKLIGFKNGIFFIYGLGDGGGDPSNYVGDAQEVSNIAAYNTWKIYEAWYQQNLYKSKLSLLFGLYDLNSEFDVLESSLPFINASHGIDPTFSQTGENGPSIFPNTTLGLRIDCAPTVWASIKSVVLNGVAGDPTNPRGTHLVFDDENGILSATEISLFDLNVAEKSFYRHLKGRRRLGRLATPWYDGKIALGYWVYSAKFNRLGVAENSGKSSKVRGNQGIYVIGERTVFHEKNSRSEGLTLFFRAGLANGTINRFSRYFGAGCSYVGLIPGRSDDRLGFAAAGAFNGSLYKKHQLMAGTGVENAEWNLELTYILQAAPWLDIQPDIQYVINPNTNPNVMNALAIDLRAVLSL